MGNYKKGGYEKKYMISKINGNNIDPNADYFVLRLDKDPNARIALRSYADSVRTCNKELADDLDQKLKEYGM